MAKISFDSPKNIKYNIFNDKNIQKVYRKG